MVVKTPNHALERKTIAEYKEGEKTGCVVVLNDVRSMHNVGSIFRTGDAFCVEQIFLCGITPCPPHRDIQKTALGATESVMWEYWQDVVMLIDKLKKEGYKVLVIEQTSKSVFLENYVFRGDEKCAFVLGNEVDGVEEKVVDMADGWIEVRQLGTKHSINVGVCAGVVLWEFYRQKKGA